MGGNERKMIYGLPPPIQLHRFPHFSINSPQNNIIPPKMATNRPQPLPILPFPLNDPPKLANSSLPLLFAQNGFVRIDGVFSPGEVAEMKEAMAKIVDGLEPEKHPRTTFNTSDEEKHVSDRYFLESADKIRFFYEEGAIDPSTGQLLVPKERALNKVGHALHWLDPTFRRFTFHERIKQILRALGTMECPLVAQSMYIFKQPKIGGPANEHVDSTFLHTNRPQGLLGIWIALDGATEANGCLWFVPGSHRECVDQTKGYKFVRRGGLEGNFEGNGPLLKFVGTRPGFEDRHFVPVECESGSLILIHGDVVHKSAANSSEMPRHAYTFHLVEKEEGEWAPTNWLQETKEYKFPELFKN